MAWAEIVPLVGRQGPRRGTVGRSRGAPAHQIGAPEGRREGVGESPEPFPLDTARFRTRRKNPLRMNSGGAEIKEFKGGRHAKRWCAAWCGSPEEIRTC